MENQPNGWLQEKMKELNGVKESLGRVEEDLEDEINDIFSSLEILLEERRQTMLSQLRSRVGGKCQRLGENCGDLSSGITTPQRHSWRA